MTPALVKFTVDLYAPGAILSTTLAKWLSNVNSFHSRRAVWPNLPLTELLDIAVDGSMALQDFCHIRVTSMMDEYDGPTDGPLDRILAEKPLEDVFDLPRICGIALTIASPYQLGTTRASWVELFKVEDEAVNFIRQISVKEIAAQLTEAPNR